MQQSASSLTNFVAFIGFEPMHRETVFMRVDRYSLDSKLGCGPQNPDCNFTTIGY